MRRMLACFLAVMVLTTCISPMSVQAQESGISGLLEEQQTDGISQDPETGDADGETGKSPEERERISESVMLHIPLFVSPVVNCNAAACKLFCRPAGVYCLIARRNAARSV